MKRVTFEGELPLGQKPSSWAVFDQNDVYRYELGRIWNEQLEVATWIMLNPSTADAFQDDPTIRKCCGFARRWNCGGIRVVNLFALRSLSPGALLTASNPVGPENTEALYNAMQQAGSRAFCAWGAFKHPRLAERVESLKMLAFDAGVSLLCLRKTSGGRPEHPLYVPYEAEPIAFEEPL